ncbi:chemotaxis protein [Nostoc linckia z18]|uniref:Chemotaxis protein n=2 Tax=Nostoc linckia TaxID=92942 RepID=A0A9Q6EL02_NOSLI|nr:methyl-accepting chemotaxis protein [Nostoc linckia]PHK40030.1 chemotaxis protein [Nostoc linckia z15]PHK44790.1 chemotaxis protein [Nostoc linckia z16]PHJ62607.1 chemotaxis protein [Nostoc linckia z1]PHJ72043.1 chemotaxis protein [Nostoc linckia z3]PHJ78011.1 chemotaxis protein [Nostoc linckia z2]
MLSHWKIKDLTLLGFSIPTVLMIGFSVMVYTTSNQISQTFRQVGISQTALAGKSRMYINLINMDRRIRRYVVDPQSNKDALDLYEKDRRDFQDSFELVEKTIENLKQKERLKNMYQIYLTYNRLKDIFLNNPIAAIDKNNTVIVTFFQDSRLNIEEFERIGNEFELNENQFLEQSITSTKSASFFLSSLTLIASIISLLIAFAATFFIAKVLSKKIAKAVEVADKISVGDLTQTVVEGATNTKDEVGQLLKAFQNMIQSLNKLIRQVQQSGIQVTSSATQIAASGKQLEATITEQLASTNEVTAAAKEIFATSKELVKTMEEVAGMSQATTTAASDSQKDLLRMETTMRQLAEATNSIAARLGVISEKANNINNIVVTITKVADQTNLLSLNAAIEAEKAGEYGLGFAVVAREIRRLADQTAVATLDIEQMVKQMQSSVSTGVMEMDKFAAEVGRSVEDVANISTQVGQIIEQVQYLAPRFEAVNQGTETQSQGAQQISDAMVQLSSTSLQTADSLREINSAIAQLNQVAQGLRQEISRFQVKV